jgi:uncharacterized protein (TIGR04255 family)
VAYKKPTLTETYAEIHLPQGVLTEARYFDVVPRLKALGFTEIEFATTGISLQVRQGRPFPREQQRVRCWKPDRTQLVQVGEDLLIVNLTGDYPGWDAFMALFDQSIRAVKSGLGDFQVESLNLATLDTLKVSKEGFSARKYLNVEGMIVPKWYGETSESFDIDLGRGLLDINGHNRQVHVNVRAAEDPVTVSIRCEFHDKVRGTSDLTVLLIKLHDESNAIFEALITDHVRNVVMGGRKG